MSDNRSQRHDHPPYDNDAFGATTGSGRGGTWSNRDDDNMHRRRSRADAPRSAYDSEMDARMDRGGAYSSAYGDEYSVSGDRYRDGGVPDRDGRDGGSRDRVSRNHGMRRSGRNGPDREGSYPDMGADSWGGAADRDTGREHYNRPDRAEHAPYYNGPDLDRNGYSGKRSMRGDSGNDSGNWDSGSDARAGSRGQWESQSPMGRGEHAGRGPKGYRRDDSRITEDINEALTHDSHIDASDIEVVVSSGEVTLSGTVDSRAAKRRAEDIADRVSGVNDVHCQIRVSRNADSPVRESSEHHGVHGSSADHPGEEATESAKPESSGRSAASDRAISAQGSGPSGAQSTSTRTANASGKPSPNTSGASVHKSGDRGAQ